MFKTKRNFFSSTPNFIKLIITSDEIDKAREIEAEITHLIGFYDIIHLILSKRSDAILITRDENLLKIAKKYKVHAKKPEELL